MRQARTRSIELVMNITGEQLEPVAIAFLADDLRFLYAEKKQYNDNETKNENKKLRKALKRILKYYLTTDEYKKLITKIKKDVKENSSKVLDDYN